MRVLSGNKYCVIAQGFTVFKAALECLGFTVIEAAPVAELTASVAAHADMQLHNLGDGKLLVASGAGALIESLRNLGLIVLEQRGIAPEYPKDVALNCFALGGKLYCNPKAVSRILIERYSAKHVEISPVKQGYAKCSTCIVNENSIITADASIAQAAQSDKLAVLRIRSGHILLQGLNYGFIGGATGLIGGNRLAVCGSLKMHPDGGLIKGFCEARGVEIIELADSPIIDIGGIICL